MNQVSAYLVSLVDKLFVSLAISPPPPMILTQSNVRDFLEEETCSSGFSWMLGSGDL